MRWEKEGMNATAAKAGNRGRNEELSPTRIRVRGSCGLCLTSDAAGVPEFGWQAGLVDRLLTETFDASPCGDVRNQLAAGRAHEGHPLAPHTPSVAHEPLADLEGCEPRPERLLVELRCLVLRLDDLPVPGTEHRPRPPIMPERGGCPRVERLRAAHGFDSLGAIVKDTVARVVDGQRFEGRRRECFRAQFLVRRGEHLIPRLPGGVGKDCLEDAAVPEIDGGLRDEVDGQSGLPQLLERPQHQGRHEPQRPRFLKDEHDGEGLLRLREVPADGVDDLQAGKQEERALEFPGADAAAVEGDEPPLPQSLHPVEGSGAGPQAHHLRVAHEFQQSAAGADLQLVLHFVLALEPFQVAELGDDLCPISLPEQALVLRRSDPERAEEGAEGFGLRLRQAEGSPPPATPSSTAGR